MNAQDFFWNNVVDGGDYDYQIDLSDVSVESYEVRSTDGYSELEDYNLAGDPDVENRPEAVIEDADRFIEQLQKYMDNNQVREIECPANNSDDIVRVVTKVLEGTVILRVEGGQLATVQAKSVAKVVADKLLNFEV